MICRKTNTVCPKCQHEFPVQWTSARRGRHDMNGGGIVQTPLSPLQSPDPASINVFITPPPFAMVPPQLMPQPAPIVHVVHHHHHHVPPPAPIIQLQPPPVGNAHPDLPAPDTVRALRRSGWYYENITYQDSQELLKDKQLGTFIVRDSSDARFLYSLSVQTERGPTSVRIHYTNGLFRLDSQQHIQSSMPSFPSVIELVEHYVEQSRRTNSPHVWVDPKGKMYSPITITRPLVKEGQKPSTLKHLARLAVNAAVKRHTASPITAPTISQLELPASVSQYLTEYPYSI
ncbi:suppressor of cytokine signaling 2-like [Atheta coriaria]|uniref:suppressor of cytokine signaling 2-like n=1 Tax=Dalotia coriaria TaxID=877792 RepID=UPI0031F36A1F